MHCYKQHQRLSITVSLTLYITIKGIFFTDVNLPFTDMSTNFITLSFGLDFFMAYFMDCSAGQRSKMHGGVVTCNTTGYHPSSCNHQALESPVWSHYAPDWVDSVGWQPAGSPTSLVHRTHNSLAQQQQSASSQQ